MLAERIPKKKKTEKKKETVQLLRKKKKNNEKKKELFVWLGHLPKYSCKKKKEEKSFFSPPFVVCDIEESPKTVFHVRRHEWYMFERRSRGKKKKHTK